MIQKINQAHQNGSVYVPPKNSYETQFGILHFAGIVHYDSKGIVYYQRPVGGGWGVFCIVPIVYVWSVYFRLS